jgi:hypothetical protein
MQAAAQVVEIQCRGRGSNPYGDCSPQDFKSCVSASSTTPAWLSTAPIAGRTLDPDCYHFATNVATHAFEVGHASGTTPNQCNLRPDWLVAVPEPPSPAAAFGIRLAGPKGVAGAIVGIGR